MRVICYLIGPSDFMSSYPDGGSIGVVGGVLAGIGVAAMAAAR